MKISALCKRIVSAALAPLVVLVWTGCKSPNTLHVTQFNRQAVTDASLPGESETGKPSIEEWGQRQVARLEALRQENAGMDMVLDPYGGWVNAPESLRMSNPDGFFRVKKQAGSWWFVTPDGHPFVSKGVTDVNWLGATLSTDSFHDLLVQKYGDEETWADASLKRVQDWGFNTIGPWSSASMAKRMTHSIIILDMAGVNAPRHPKSVVTDYWDPAFADHCAAMARERATPYVEDKNLLGYFLDNEIVWGSDHFRTKQSLLQLYLGFPAGAPGRDEALRFIRESMKTIEKFNASWGTSIADSAEIENLPIRDFHPKNDAAQALTREFMLKVFHQYATISIAALRAVDPNHLIMGCRFHNYPDDALVEAAARYFDVIAMAFYEARPPVKEIDAVFDRIDKPFLIEEWTFKADESGIVNPQGIYAPVVPTMAARSLAYGNYVETFMRRPYAVGYHWYKWMDNPKYPEKKYSGDNCGLLNQNDEPYESFVEHVREVNLSVETWHAENIQDHEAHQITLVAEGAAKAVVVTAAAPSKIAAYAARELVEHIEKATGVRLDIVAEGSGENTAPHCIYIGATAAAKARRYSPETLAPDVFVLRTEGPNLYVFGREDQEAEPLRNDVPSGTLFGVYELLERYVGVRWMWPGELGTVVPRLDALAIEESLNEEQAPRLRFRNIYWYHVNSAAADYKPEVERLAFSPTGLQAYCKDLEIFLKRNRMGFSEPKPKVSHNFCGWWPKYGKDHPDWFMLNDEGTRGPGSKALLERWRLQHVGMCVSNPELQRFLVGDAWDGGDTIDLSETDYRAFCVCDMCRAWDVSAPDGYYPDLHRMGWDGALEGLSEYDDFIPMNVSDRYARFWKTIRDMAKERNPNVTVGTFLYWNYFPAPLQEINLEGVYGEFVPWTRANKWMPMPDEAYEWNKQQWIGWQKTGIQLAYRPNYFHGGYVMPQISTWQAGEFIRFAYAHGMMGANFDSLLGMWAVKAPMFYVHFRLFWNPELEVSQLRNEYFSAFGPAAPLVEQYTDYWEQHAAKVCVPLDPWPESGLWSPTRAHIHYPEESFATAAALLEQAHALAEQSDRPEHARRVAFLQHGIEHARLAARLMAALVQGRAPVFDPPRFKKAQQALQELIAYRRAYEHEYIADYLYPAMRENEFCEMNVLFRKAEDVLVPNLNENWGVWHFRKDPENRGIEEAWFSDAFLRDDWKFADIPGYWEEDYQGYGWYSNTVQIPEDWNDKTVTLLFEGVSEEAWVYVNGQFVGEHTVNSTKLPPAILRTWPFEISIPKDVLRLGAVNTVVVRVNASRHPGGISGPVYGYSKSRKGQQDTKKPWG